MNSFEDATLKADIIDGVVRTMIVAKNEVYDKDANPEFTKFDIRSAIAMALDLYSNPNPAIIDMMNRIERR